MFSRHRRIYHNNVSRGAFVAAPVLSTSVFSAFVHNSISGDADYWVYGSREFDGWHVVIRFIIHERCRQFCSQIIKTQILRPCFDNCANTLLVDNAPFQIVPRAHINNGTEVLNNSECQSQWTREKKTSHPACTAARLMTNEFFL